MFRNVTLKCLTEVGKFQTAISHHKFCLAVWTMDYLKIYLSLKKSNTFSSKWDWATQVITTLLLALLQK